MTGGVILIIFTTIPSLLILIINSVLYIFIWRKINVESKRIQGTLGRAAASTRATHQAAKTMMLFIVMFIIQWTPSAVFGVWELICNTPPVVVLLTVMLSNSGGILNGSVFVIIYRKKGKTDREPIEHSKTQTRLTTV